MAYDWKKDLQRLEEKYDIPPGLLGALVRAESGGRQNARSPVGAIGLTQLMPSTARGLGVDPHNPASNLEGGAKYLSQQLRRFKDVNKALAAYNAGPGAVQRYGGIPPYKETRQYVERLNGFWRESSRYGQSHTNKGGKTQQNGSQVYQGGRKPISPVKVPTALPDPERKTQPGLESNQIAGLQQAYQKKPHVADIILNQRARQQQQYDTEYNTKLTAQQARQAQIEEANRLNQRKLQQANRYKPGSVGQQTSFGPASSLQSPSGLSKGGFYRTPNGWVQGQRAGEAGWQFLQRLGTKGFGLQNDPGNSQTFGGGHEDGSEHYSHRAIDFGTARNPRPKLNTWREWLKRNGFDALDEGDHIHTSLPGSVI